jgi:hypothetical protein
MAHNYRFVVREPPLGCFQDHGASQVVEHQESEVIVVAGRLKLNFLRDQQGSAEVVQQQGCLLLVGRHLECCQALHYSRTMA